MNDNYYYERLTFEATALMAEQMEETHEMLESYLTNLSIEAQKQKLLKSALTRYTAIMDVLDEVKDPLLKCHLYVIHLFNRHSDFDLIALKADDIATQKEAKLQLARLKEMSHGLVPLEEQYMASPYAKLFEEIKAYQAFEKNYGLTRRPVYFNTFKPMEPALLVISVLIVSGGGLFLLAAFVSVTLKKTAPEDVAFGVGLCVATLVLTALFLYLLAKQFKVRKMFKEGEQKFLQDIQAWNMKKKELDEALKNHKIYRYIASLKQQSEEYVQVWDRIKTIESHFEENKKTGVKKKKTAEEEVHDFLRM